MNSRTSTGIRTLWVGLALVLITGLTVDIHRRLWALDLTGQDIYYCWLDGQRIANGENPYGRILAGNMTDNSKYSTYFPAVYLLAALFQWLGVTSFASWEAFWRSIVLVAHLGIGVVIGRVLCRRYSAWMAILGASFWLFNRWSLVVTEIAHIDFVPLLLLVWSLAYFNAQRRLSLIAFGLSLAFKHVALLMMPLYLIWVWQSSDRDRRADVIRSAAIMLAFPVLLSLPFLIWSPEGYARSILFSLTRVAESHANVHSVDVVLGLQGIAARLPMFAVMSAAYWVAWQYRFSRYLSALLVMSIFTSFNPVLFWQYMCWSVPFVPLATADVVGGPLNPCDGGPGRTRLGGQ